MSVGQNIKNRRKELGISAETLAERINVSAATIYRYEKGSIRRVDSTVLMSIADALNTSPVALMGYEIDEKASAESNTGAQSPERVITPDLEKAALKATETIRDYQVTSGPILPMPMLKATQNVFVISFTEMATETGIDSVNLEMEFGAQNQDVVTVAHEINGRKCFFVAYNQRLPFYMLQFSLARELGHIVLGHTNAMPENVRMIEALYFARYLLCPRPLIRAMQDRGIVLNVETVGNITGCYGRCLAGIRKTPGAHISVELNRQIKAQFADYVERFLEYQHHMPSDKSAKADFGTYMDNYQD